MLRDMNAGPVVEGRPFDVCIVGAGPAGITLAMALARHNKRVALCEAGGFDLTQESQSCYRGDVVGDPYFPLDAARLRYFGGTSGHWGGWCHSLDPVVFEAKGRASPLAHWPIKKRDLDPYLAPACVMVEVKPPAADRILSNQAGIRETFFSYSSTRFGSRYRKEIIDSRAIELFLNANLTKVRARDGRVDSCEFRSYSGNTVNISAQNVVFAMGGIENSRQLLWHNIQNSGKLFAPSLPVGRYWMEHPHYSLGEALVDFKRSRERRFMSLVAGEQLALGVLNCGLRLEPASHGRMKRLIKEMVCVAPELGERAAALADRNLLCGIKLRAAWEQEPVFGNHIALSPTKRDRFGVPLSMLYWRKGPLERKTIRSTVLQYNKYLNLRRFGRLKVDDWVVGRGDYPTDDELGGFHHMGGARMAESPVHGVVDRNCRVFGTKNLYVAGSAVFPAGGASNPTLTIVQLSLRMADHLAA